MQTLAQRSTVIKHYASYLIAGEEVYGTAELVNGSGYLFRREGELKATLVSYPYNTDFSAFSAKIEM
jgi:hypothetical protein